VLPHAVAVARIVTMWPVVDEPVDQRGGHDLVPKELAPLLKALVGGQHGGGLLVAARIS